MDSPLSPQIKGCSNVGAEDRAECHRDLNIPQRHSRFPGWLEKVTSQQHSGRNHSPVALEPSRSEELSDWDTGGKGPGMPAVSLLFIRKLSLKFCCGCLSLLVNFGLYKLIFF